MDLTTHLYRLKIVIFLPIHRRDDGTSTNANGECSNHVTMMAPQRLFANTNPVMLLGAYDEPLPFARSTGVLFNHL